MERECEEGGMERNPRRSFLVGNYYNRTGPSTPPPTWRLELSPPRVRVSSSAVVERKEFLGNSEVSVRKLCAELWKTQQFQEKIGPRRRRNSDVESSSDNHQAQSRGSLRKQIVESPGSSAVKSTSHGLTSSTKLLKMLNRIWSLEEQNAANMSLVKGLKMELDECRAEIKEVKQRERHSSRRVTKNKEEEQDELKDLFRSMKNELNDEKELRKKSESMHRKLTRELCEAKHCLAKALKDLEKERKERVVVENLCEEFAKTSHSSKRIDFREKHEDSASMHQRVCLKELQERLERRTRRDNKLKLKRFDLSMSSEGDKIHPESSPWDVDKHRSLKDKLMEARVESRRFRSLKPENSPRHPV